jgi:L-cysteine:1D-myo-inositol 2-amino-2-deoxy-alpha-D-glucopyranoside ligase
VPGPAGRSLATLAAMQSWPPTAVPRLPGTADRSPLLLHDSATGGRTDVTPAQGTARLYVCGITPYDATHLGHAATYLAFDTLVRVWLDRGLAVEYVQNVTDIDDPLLERAQRDGEDWIAVAERETALFRDDMAALRVLPPTHYVGAVEAMDEITAFVAGLLDSGAAYRLSTLHGDDVYFSVDAAEHFGSASAGVLRRDQDVMRVLSAERGGDPDRAGKKNPLDPLVWLAARPGEPSWDSPLGRGRPGWHVECTAIALNRLGTGFDVQGGGSDLVFPHHEMSAAHAEVATRSWPFARAYVHAGMVGLDGEKMSKSRGNLVFVSQLRRAGTDPAALRLALLSAHYRADRDWTDEVLGSAVRRLEQWRTAVARPSGPPAAPLLERLRAALSDDLDTPTALALLDTWADADGDDPDGPRLVRDAVDALLGVRL